MYHHAIFNLHGESGSMSTVTLSGASRMYFIVGDPIAQVKSPAGVTQSFHARNRDAFVLPAHVAPAHLSTWVQGVSLAQNVDGIIVTVPHKFASCGLCATVSDSARFLGTVNTMRRNADGSWHGDMFDGTGFVSAMRDQGCEPVGRRALLVGAGGAGSAIAYALVTAGVTALAIHDEDAARRMNLVQRLAGLGLGNVSSGSADPSGFDIVVNATPAGMKVSDGLPVDVDRLQRDTFVGCVITQPAVTPLIAAARDRGCNTVTGADMFAKVRDLMMDFLLSR